MSYHSNPELLFSWNVIKTNIPAFKHGDMRETRRHGIRKAKFEREKKKLKSPMYVAKVTWHILLCTLHFQCIALPYIHCICCIELHVHEV